MEYCQTTLKNLLKKPLQVEEVREFYKQLMEGLACIHEKRLIHMDIKPENLFIDSSGTLKIGDFGLAVFSDEKDGDLDSSSYVGNPTYQAPELRDDNPTLTEKVDIFSAGLVLLEMVCSPIGTISEKSRLFERARRGEFPGEAGPVSNMMGASLSSDPSARPSASRILSKYYDA